MYTRFVTTLLAIFSVICAYQIGLNPSVAASQMYKISSVTNDIQSDSLEMTISGNAAPAYTVSERFDPYRLILDIADTELDASITPDQILPANNLAKLNLSLLKDQDPPLARFEFTIGENATYDVQRIENDINIKILAQPGSPAVAAGADNSMASMDAEASAEKTVMDESIFDSPQDGAPGLQMPQAEEQDDLAQLEDTFSFSGYTGERISVDFYKIDLHNVFRLFREISGMNIIVDQAVNGTLTLALNDVPWEFALDVIMNLTGLQKVERFNTLVIYPQNKNFSWPEQAEDNLSFEADIEVVKEEALIISESATQPAEIMQAKELLIEAYKLEEENKFEEAVTLYEQAFKLWPDNNKISDKLANLYLGRLNINAKASYYAQKSMEIDPADTRAALYCAISAANMERTAEALECFAQSISDDPPKKEALISYAAFTENNNRLEQSLKLLDTFENYYGDTVHTLVSKARIYDKLGNRDKAKEQYRSLLASGLQMRPDLKAYIQSRVTAGN